MLSVPYLFLRKHIHCEHNGTVKRTCSKIFNTDQVVTRGLFRV